MFSNDNCSASQWQRWGSAANGAPSGQHADVSALPPSGSFLGCSAAVVAPAGACLDGEAHEVHYYQVGMKSQAVRRCMGCSLRRGWLPWQHRQHDSLVFV